MEIHYFEDAAQHLYKNFYHRIHARQQDTHYCEKVYIREMKDALRSSQKDLSEPSMSTYYDIAEIALDALKVHSIKTSAEIINDCRELLISKQRDYGPRNILIFGHAGVVVRMTDKIERLANLTQATQKPRYESLEDTYMDIINYCMIGLLLHHDYMSLPMKGVQ